MKTLLIRHFFLKTPKFVFKLAYFIIGLVVIGVVGYFLANFYLRGIYGNDSNYALSMVYWVNKYFPKIPFWYHLQGAGVSMKWSYPLLASILVVLVNKLTHLGLLGSFQIVTFASYILVALGMYLFVWLRLKNQTAALIAAVIYFIMPMTYAWMADWGFFAETVSYIFFFPILIFYDLFLEGFLTGKLDFWRRLSLFLTLILGFLLFNTHPHTFFTLIFVIGVQTFLYVLFRLLKDRKKRKTSLVFFKAIFPSVLIFVLILLLTAFVVFNFIYYGQNSLRGEEELLTKFKNNDLEFFLSNYSLERDLFLGIARINFDHFQFPLRNMTIQPMVWVPALIGLVLSLVFYRKTFFYVLIALFGFSALTFPAFFFKVGRFLILMQVPGVTYFMNMRVYLNMMRFLLPIAAGFGFVGLGRLLLFLPTFWTRYIKNKIVTSGVLLVRNLLVAIFALVAFVYSLYFMADQPKNMWPWYYARYGYWLIDIRSPVGKFLPIGATDVTFGVLDPEISGYEVEVRQENLWRACQVFIDQGQTLPVCTRLSPLGDLPQDTVVLAEFEAECKTLTLPSPENQICPMVVANKKDLHLTALYSLKDLSYWPKPRLLGPEEFENIVFNFEGYREFVDQMSEEKNLRVDVSPTNGGVAMGLNMVSEMSMVNLYTFTASLIGPYWGHEQQVLFQENDGREETAREVANWFGTKYLLINSGLDAFEKYFQSDNWEGVLWDIDKRPRILKFKNPPEMATWTKGKPKVLVIGNKERRVFEPIFRASNKGTLPYEDFWLVEGEERIDDYSLEELKKFEILYLFGYGYKNKRRAWDLIDNYLREGGKVFLSTGWQYVDQDWEAKETPLWFPATSLSWTDQFNQTSTYNFNLSVINRETDVSRFGLLEWNGVGYGVSVPQGLREWARPVLSVDGTPLVAVGEYGQGKVVWTGLNLIGHMHSFDYPEAEILFHQSLFDWLRGPIKAVDLTDSIKIIRDHPDKVNFEFVKTTDGPTTLYWRESAFPSWKAKLVSGKKSRSIKIYYGGPRLMLMQLENIKAGDKLTLEFKPGIRHSFLIFVSMVTFLTLVLYVILGKKIYEPALIILGSRLRKVRLKVKESWEKEEE